MEDYGTVKVETILDIMKVMSFAMKQGKVCCRLMFFYSKHKKENFLDCCTLSCWSWSYGFCYLFISCT